MHDYDYAMPMCVAVCLCGGAHPPSVRSRFLGLFLSACICTRALAGQQRRHACTTPACQTRWGGVACTLAWMLLGFVTRYYCKAVCFTLYGACAPLLSSWPGFANGTIACADFAGLQAWQLASSAVVRVQVALQCECVACHPLITVHGRI